MKWIGEQILEQRDTFLERTLPEWRSRLAHVADWIDQEPLLEWVRPSGGVVCFPRMRSAPPGGPEAFYRRLVERYGTYVGPGHWFEMPDTYFRIGYGWSGRQRGTGERTPGDPPSTPRFACAGGDCGNLSGAGIRNGRGGMVTTGAKFNLADAMIARPRSPVHVARIALILLMGCIAVPASVWASDPGRVYNVHGTKLYVEVLGSGPPIVFLHGGLSFFDSSFAYQKAYFAAFRTVVGIDQRGHGHSPDDAQPFSYREMAEDTAALLQQLHLGPADIVGHSDGGNVALLLARYHPDLVRRVVVSGANFRGDIAGLFAYVRLRWGTSEQRFAAGIPVTVRHDYDAVSPDGDRHWDDLVAKTKDLWTTWTVISRGRSSGHPYPSADHGRLTTMCISLEHTIALYRSLPAGRLCILPNTGHETMAERPSLFNELTRAFLDEEDLR